MIKAAMAVLAPISAVVVAGGASAQARENAAQQATPSPESRADTSGGELGDIVVTAQRREQKLQDVPIAVTALGAPALAQANVSSGLDIGKVASGVIFQQSTGTVTSFVRGIGNNQLAVGNEPSVSLYIDGIYFSRISPALLRFNNVDRIELLKGPQGTLFGRNATGGLINIITQSPKPGQAPELNASIGYGNYQTFDASFYTAASLGDKVAVSLGGVYNNQAKGWGANQFTGEETFKEKSGALRFKAVLQASDLTKITLEADYNKSDSSIGLLGNFYGRNPAPAGYGDGTGLIPQISSRYDKAANIEDLANTKGYGGYLRLEQDLPFATMIVTAALHNEKLAYHNDLDKSPQNYFHFVSDNVRNNQHSAELQLNSLSGSSISWTGGLFYLRQSFGYPTPSTISGDAFGPGVKVLVSDSGTTTSYAAYAQATFDILPRLRGTVGGRFNRDELVGRGLTDLDIDGVGFIPGVPMERRTSSDKFTYRFALDYKVNDDVLLYASASRGTKAGVFNIVTFDPIPVKPEVLDAYEIGAKSELFDRHLRINGAAFYYDYTNPQVSTQQASGVTRLSNAKSARVRGAEIEIQLAASRALTLRGSITYIDAQYTNYPDAPIYQPNPALPYGLLPAVSGSAVGNRLSRAPKFSGNAGASYKLELPSGDLLFGVNYTYTGKFYWNPDNLIVQRAYGLLDGTITYNIGSTGATVQAWGSNLTGAKYNITAQEFAGPVGVSSGPGAPRTYGIRLKYKM